MLLNERAKSKTELHLFQMPRELIQRLLSGSLSGLLVGLLGSLLMGHIGSLLAGLLCSLLHGLITHPLPIAILLAAVK